MRVSASARASATASASVSASVSVSASASASASACSCSHPPSLAQLSMPYLLELLVHCFDTHVLGFDAAVREHAGEIALRQHAKDLKYIIVIHII